MHLHVCTPIYRIEILDASMQTTNPIIANKGAVFSLRLAEKEKQFDRRSSPLYLQLSIHGQTDPIFFDRIYLIRKKFK